jgi:hypothetical protein
MKCPKCKAENRDGARFCKRCGEPLAGAAEPKLPKPSVPATHVHIEGNVSGQVAIGNNILQIGDVNGGIVNVMVPGQEIRPKARPTPVDLRPRPFPEFLDREQETDTAAAAITSATPIEFRASAGMGKTSLLRHLAHHPTAASLPDGVIYLSGRGQPLGDLLQSLHDALYECDVPVKPTEVQLRHALGTKQALVIVDDVGVTREETQTLLDTAPACAFVLASLDRRLWGEGTSIPLQGLSVEDGLALIECELGCPLTPKERGAAKALHGAVRGHPLTLIQEAAKARESKRALHELLAPGTVPSAAATAGKLPDQARQLLAALAAMGGTPIHADHLAALSGLPDVTPALQTLSALRLAQAHSPRYSLAGGLNQALQQAWDLTPWMEQALAHFVRWAKEQQSPERLLEDADAIFHVLDWAVSAGYWRSGLRLGGALERALALGGRWASWVQVLGWMHQAALALGDKGAEAWVLHQLGTRSLCLGKGSAARASLKRALQLREALGDQAGAAVTKHNLALLVSAPPPQERQPPPNKPGSQIPGWLLPAMGAGAIVALAAVIAIGAVVIPHIIPTPEVATATPTATPTRTSTEEPVPEPGPPTLLEPPDGYEMPCLGEGSQSISLHWYPDESIDSTAHYEVEVTRHPAYPPTPDTWAVGVEDAETALDVECGDSFEWRVRQVDEEGNESTWSETWTFRVLTLNESDAQGPSAPIPVRPGTSSAESPETVLCTDVTLEWKAATDNPHGSGVADYSVNLQYYDDGWRSVPPYAVVYDTSLDVTEYLTLDIARYRWNVRARDLAGNTGDESGWMYFECDTTPPPAPTGLEPGNDDPAAPESGDCPWNLTWDAVSDPSGVWYEVEMQRREGENEWPEQERMDGLSINKATISDCAEYTTYRWRVRAYDGGGNTGKWSKWAYIQTTLW